MRWKSTPALHRTQPKSAARRSTPRGLSKFPYVLLKSDAPLKRNIFAWRRRPIPRVMQCPRQGYVWDGMKKVQPGLRTTSDVETGFCGARIWSRVGWSSRFSPSSATSPRSPMRRGRLAIGRVSACVKAAPGPASIPGGSGWAAAAADAVSTARRGGPAGAAARAPARG